MQSLKTYRNEAKGMPDLLNWAALVDEGVMLGKDGSFTAGWWFMGMDVDTATHVERNAMASRLNQALSSLGSGYMVHVDTLREVATSYPSPEDSAFPHPVMHMMDESRRLFFESQGDKFATRSVLFITWRPSAKRLSKVTDLLFDHGESKRASMAQRNLELFKDKMADIQGRLSGVFSSLTRLGVVEKHAQAFDEMLAYLRFSLTGVWQPISVACTPLPLDSFIGGVECWPGFQPKVGDLYTSVISIDGFPDFSHPNMLHHLSLMNVAFRWSTRFIFFDANEAHGLLDKERKKWQQKVVSFRDKLLKNPSPKIDEDALEMVTQYQQAQTDLSSGRLSYGQYTSTFVLRHQDIDVLSEVTEYVMNILNNTLGLTCRVETVNATEALLGTLASDSLHNIRRPLLSTLNLCHLLPTANIWTGEAHCPCPFYPDNSPPLMVCTAAGNTPFRLNLHVSDVGHTLMFGPTGAGKSTLLAMLVAQMSRYPNARIFAFDKSHSMYALSQLGGLHLDIGANGSREQPAFAPLAALDDDFEWCCDYIEKLVVLQGETVTSDMRSAIFKALSDMKGSPRRSLSEFHAQVQDDRIKGAVKYYTIEGRSGDLLDAEVNTLALSDFTVFEMNQLMSRGERDLVPVLVYLFRCIERRLDGHPSFILIDEGWVALGHPVFREMLREWLKELRKANCLVLLATQSLTDAIASGMLDVLIESCPTQIFLPNLKAAQFSDTYHQFGLNDKQIALLTEAVPKQDYYISQPVGGRLIDLSLDKLALAFVGASDKESVATIRELVEEHGDNWYVPYLKQKHILEEE
ncbi:conjugal transfer protein TrbE [Vibrio sp. 10N.222.54.A1]|uniref:VirB4 family type IV secretion/conjugal transfer ATPase n=1 Tax=unclassified Vibrio TaxID=2614977 RepID=UPI0010BDCF41|nr:conjugal transfer protein TrbE [Vibrio sp. F13]TKF93331.1 conjugal transfer protein TrbE [Vibrio sp. F13]